MHDITVLTLHLYEAEHGGQNEAKSHQLLQLAHAANRGQRKVIFRVTNSHKQGETVVRINCFNSHMLK